MNKQKINMYLWTSVKDRLPERTSACTRCLCIVDGDEDKVVFGNYFWRYNEKHERVWSWACEFAGDDALYDAKVTHWLPLPSPPKKEDDQLNRTENKFHRDIRDITDLSPEARRLLNDIEKMSKANDGNRKVEPLFDRLSTAKKVFFLAALVLLVPLWFPLWIYQQLLGGKMKNERGITERGGSKSSRVS